MRSNQRIGIDGLTLAALGLMLIMVVNIVTDREPRSAQAAVQEPPTPTAKPDLDRVIAPYESYILTQGPHGQSYGQLAIDLTAGKGAVIRSPIEGEVTALYVDNLGNTTLVIENRHYQVILMHGLYDVSVGQHLNLAQPVGTESNQGYTIDAYGNLCTGRDCGYHTHFNVFDKYLNENVNPLTVMEK